MSQVHEIQADLLNEACLLKKKKKRQPPVPETGECTNICHFAWQPIQVFVTAKVAISGTELDQERFRRICVWKTNSTQERRELKASLCQQARAGQVCLGSTYQQLMGKAASLQEE